MNMKKAWIQGLALCFLIFYSNAAVRAAASAPSRSAASTADPTEWRDLFEGGDFSAWTQLDGSPVSGGWLGGWRIENGIVERYGFWPGAIITREKYQAFELRFEWKISEGGNSGIKYRTEGRAGLEYQILDDARHPDGKQPSHRAASLYDLAAASSDKALRPVGAWNTGRIRVGEATLEHWLNGERVVDLKMEGGAWENRIRQSKFRDREGFGLRAGPILLQDHRDPVWFRNVRIRRLQTGPENE